MFNKLIIVFSITGVLFTFVSLQHAENTQELNTNNIEVSQISLPQQLSPDLLEVEKTWFAAQKAADDLVRERNKPKAEEKALKEDLFGFNLDGKEYKLIGTFLVEKKPFIVLKQESKFIKLFEGDELVAGYKLSTVKANTITFNKENKITEFKLFERNKQNEQS